MTRLFTNIRRFSHASVFVFTLIVLGVAANLASNFLGTSAVPKGVIIFSLTVTPATILGLILLTSYSQPRTELGMFVIIAILWVAEAAWVTDVIGNVQCEQIPSSSRIPTKTSTASAQSYCYQMKVIEAFSWTNFALFTLFSIILISLGTRAHSLNGPEIWSEPIAELPWYGQHPGYDDDNESRRGSRYDPRAPYGASYAPGAGQPNGAGGFYPMMAQPSAIQQQYPGGGYVVQQQPGHSVVIQPGQNGQHTVSQVPGMVQQM